MPPVLASISEWPAQLRHLVGSFGAARVWRTGLRVLGFPPTWIHATNEATAVLIALEREGSLG